MMAGECHNACSANKVEAEKMLAEMIALDGRFKNHDPAALARRVGICGGSGAQLNLEDSALQRGGAPNHFSDPRFR
jgi:hypothetical protein